MPRVDKDRQEKLEPIRMAETKAKLEELGFNVESFGNSRLEFIFNGNKITFYPYSGWHTGKGIKDGRGFEKLLKQIQNR